METIAYIGFGLLLIGGLGLIIAAFRTGIWWGVGSVLFAPVSLVFIIVHWREAKKPFFLQLFGLALIFGAAYLSDEKII